MSELDKCKVSLCDGQKGDVNFKGFNAWASKLHPNGGKLDANSEKGRLVTSCNRMRDELFVKDQNDVRQPLKCGDWNRAENVKQQAAKKQEYYRTDRRAAVTDAKAWLKKATTDEPESIKVARQSFMEADEQRAEQASILSGMIKETRYYKAHLERLKKSHRETTMNWVNEFTANYSASISYYNLLSVIERYAPTCPVGTIRKLLLELWAEDGGDLFTMKRRCTWYTAYVERTL
jgi:hypothetical protein